jgi:3-hydroxybutyryl-CoA dehydrogenase
MVYVCDHCNKSWSHPISQCIFCGNEIKEIREAKYKILGRSKVNIPAASNEKVPYFSYLLQDKNNVVIAKSCYEVFDIGDEIELNTNKQKNLRVGIIGTGQMGTDIAAYVLRYGNSVVVKTRSNQSSERALSRLISKLLKGSSQMQVDQYVENLEITTDYVSLENCDIVIEAVPEKLDIKREVFKNLSKVCNSETIFATNSSSISIDAIARITDRPEKCIGMHFFNPVSKMDLIEVVIGRHTSEDTKNKIIDFSVGLNKKAIIVKDSPGFIVNRLLLPQINEAVSLLEGGIATKEGIDQAIISGLGHPMGPFALADLIGIDVCVSILETLHNELSNDRYKPAATLYDMVRNNKLGKKAGEGFYKY